MKHAKKWCATLLALLLAFSALSTGMTALAAEEPEPSGPLASLTVNGKAVDLEKNPVECEILNISKTSAKLKWKFREECSSKTGVTYYTNTSINDFKVKNGGTVKLPKSGWAKVLLWGGGRYYDLYLYQGKPRLNPQTLWMGETEASGNEFDPTTSFNSLSKLVAIKSSRPGVVKIRQYGDTLKDCIFEPRKPGKSKITADVIINGKKTRLTTTYTVKKYPNALKELKVDGRKVNLKDNKFFGSVSLDKKRVKVKFRLGKGWKLKSCTCYDEKADKYVNLKSGGTVTLVRDEEEEFCSSMVYFILVKGKDVFTYELSLQASAF